MIIKPENHAHKIGESVAGKGIFLGQWEPENTSGTGINKTFNLYAANKDLPGFKTSHISHNEMLERIGHLNSFEGRKLLKAFTSTAIVGTMANGTYNGEFFLPPFDVVKHALLANREEGDIGATLTDSRYHTSSKSTVKPTKSWLMTVAGSGLKIDRDERVAAAVRLIWAEPAAKNTP